MRWHALVVRLGPTTVGAAALIVLTSGAGAVVHAAATEPSTLVLCVDKGRGTVSAPSSGTCAGSATRQEVATRAGLDALRPVQTSVHQVLALDQFRSSRVVTWAACPAGFNATGGGWSLHNPSGGSGSVAQGVEVVGAVPGRFGHNSADGDFQTPVQTGEAADSWIFTLDVTSGSSGQFDYYASCVSTGSSG